MTSYEHKVKNIYLWSPYNEGQPLIPGDYTLLRWPCDEGFHVPLKEELQAIIDVGLTFSQAKVNLHIPIAGGRSAQDGSWINPHYGYLLSSSPNGDKICQLYLNSSYMGITDTTVRSVGMTVRAFRDAPIIPDSSWTETLNWKVWYNSTLWLISILVWTNQYITMQDKNVWATVVYNDWDTLTNANRGKYFQRWNNYWFTYWSTWDTSSTRVDASGYWPNNPYSSSTFITTPSWTNDRSTVQNDNLRWYTDFNS